MRTTTTALLLTPFLALLAVAGISRPATGDGDVPPKATPEQSAFFESKIRPLLIESCQSCHNKDSALGGLRLDSRAALLKGGDTGPSLVPGHPEKSLLLEVVRHTGKMKMPQGGAKLSDEKIAALAAWVEMGAPWPEVESKRGGESVAKKPGEFVKAPLGDENWRSFWSLQTVKKPATPKVKNVAWAKTPIDAFVLAKIEAKNLTPAPPIEKRALLRRVAYDLTGLPPSAAEMDIFLKDKSPDAYEKAVDRLLASPQYGERQARLWLDIARYADTKGYVFVEDRNYYNAYTYRDWVIKAFNRDLPYDKFLTAQLAADRIPETQGDEKGDLAALGFLTIGRRFLNNQPDIIDDRIDVTMRGMQGLTVSCARCHDHKFDPIPTKDYYSLYGIFNSSFELTPPISPKPLRDPWEAYNRKVAEADNNVGSLIDSQVKDLREKVKDPAKGATLSDAVKKALQSVRENERPEGNNLKTLEMAFDPAKKSELDKWRATREELKKSAPPTPEFAMAMADKGDAGDVQIFKRGNPGNPGDVAPRRFLLALTPEEAERPLWKQGSGRWELAQSIASQNNPLTARVFVNRVWMQHFGTGIVRTPSDFGKQGERPTHPELLDYLASTFMQDGWSIKRLHRRIVFTNAYRQAADITPQKQLADPENRLFAHQNRRRLDIEQMRDSLLLASGKLDATQVGGKSVELWTADYKPRRSVYGFIERQNLPGIFRTFDFASPDTTNAQRFRTTVPQQALFMMNSKFAVEQARALANRPEISNAADDAARVWRLYLTIFNRPPTNDELQVGVAFLRQPMAPETPEIASSPEQDWQYGFGGYDEVAQRVTGFTPLAHFADNSYRVGAAFPDPKLGFITLNADGGHPGHDIAHSVIRRWLAPRNATITITGTLNRPGKDGDGVRALIISNRGGKLGEWTAHASEAKTDVKSVTVRKGETIDFVVDPLTSDSFDAFAWSPVITESTEKNGQVQMTMWNAKHHFRAPQKPIALLTRREQYAQALLMTNEFFFVD